MIEQLKKELIKDWDEWLTSFKKFVNYGVHDDESKMWKFRYERDYCTWKTVDGNLYTISFRYVHCLTENGSMYCLRESNPEKLNLIENYKILYSNVKQPILPLLKNCEEISIDNIPYYYTEFVSPNNELGYPPAFNLANIMINSNDVPNEFGSYIRTLVDSHCILVKTAHELGLPYYKNHHALVNHFVDSKNFYFKDTMFEFASEEYTINELITDWANTFDGFRRAKGIISAYKSRPNSTEDGVNAIYKEIENLINYAEEQCQKLID